MRSARRFGWLTAALLTAGLVTGSSAVGAASYYVHAQGPLQDFQPTTANATDGASADLYAQVSGSTTAFRVYFSGLAPSAAGATFGVHIHVGQCVAGAPLTAGPHYNTGGTPSTSTEVWLDFTVRAGGYGYATTTVPFVIASGAAQSMVIHALPTGAGGVAGARQACLPVSF